MFANSKSTCQSKYYSSLIADSDIPKRRFEAWLSNTQCADCYHKIYVGGYYVKTTYSPLNVKKYMWKICPPKLYSSIHKTFSETSSSAINYDVEIIKHDAETL